MIPGSFELYALLILKTISLIGLVTYAIFAGVLVRQEQLMADVLEEGFEPVLRMITWLHFLAAIAILFLAFFLL